MARDKALFLPASIDMFSHFSTKRNLLWYLLVASCQGASNEYTQHIFSWRSKKNIAEVLLMSTRNMFLWRNKKKTLLSKAMDQFLVVTIFLTLNTVEPQ